jgi:hypothetical protein
MTFKTLRSRGIASEDLFQWSISVDVIEQYAIYLAKNDTTLDEQEFYNCSHLWFGSRCQYTFSLNISIESFGVFLISSFNSREQFSYNLTIHTCYPYLSECYRGPKPMCLDWREVCDGKIDCIGESLAIDEEYCEELEINECAADEYRCHNGAQCIPMEFFQDGWPMTDCLDGTDEDDSIQKGRFTIARTKLNCIKISTFPCEERSCRQTQSFSCGDGDCRDDGLIQLGEASCPGTNRDVRYLKTMYRTAEQLPYDCSRLLYCKLLFYLVFKNDQSQESDCSLDDLLLSSNCSLEFLPFPSEPIFYDHLQLIYSSADLIGSKTPTNVFPVYVCYDLRRCRYQSSATVHNEDLFCVPYEEIAPPGFFQGLYAVQRALASFAWFCLKTGNIYEYSSSSSLYYCESSDRYISQHRLVDGFGDCYHDEDEKYEMSCSLNDSRRLSCNSKAMQGKCLAMTGIVDYLMNCRLTYFQSNEYRPTIYPLLCDRINDYIDEFDDRDEDNCLPWPCLTPYSRCDAVFQCPNGIDELNCPSLGCGADELKCSIQNSSNYRCVPPAHIYEKPINCSMDPKKVSVCRTLFYSSNFSEGKNKYLSWEQKPCLRDRDICNDQSVNNRPSECNLVTTVETFICNRFLLNMDDNKQTFCSLRNKPTQSRATLPFSVWNLGYLPLITNRTSLSSPRRINMKTRTNLSMIATIASIEYCNRGILIYQSKFYQKKCLCPPNYFGDQCQWQNQRISLTIRIRQLSSVEQDNPLYDLFIYLIDVDDRTIYSYEKINFIPSIDCETKFSRYLLYPTRPKDANRTYSIHIDMFHKMTLNYYASWYLSIPFPFLPVNRLSTQILIPYERSQPSTNRSLQCGPHGQCFAYINSAELFCKCHQGYSGRFCHIKHACSCSSDSICLNTSICLCPLHKFGSKCYLQYTSCNRPTNPCQNDGQCVPMNDRINHESYICLCPDGYTGTNCEYTSIRIDINLRTNLVPSIIFAHFITTFDDRPHELLTTAKKVPFDQHSITFFNRQSFHVLFIEFFNNYYLTVLRETSVQSEHITTDITVKNMCLNITQLLNSTIFTYSYLRQMKHYQIPCVKNPELMCFYDAKHLCICDRSRYANCMYFIHRVSYDCRSYNPCQNRGKCFQDNITCPSRSMCVCEQCYYGNKCQFNTKGFSLSLDALFGYYIKSYVSFFAQVKAVKITASVTVLMFVCGLINAVLSIMTFRRKKSVQVGCGIYLLTTSIVSLFIICTFTIKYWQLILFQMNVFTNRALIRWSCLLTDGTLKIFLSASDWLNAFVAIERAYTAVQGARFSPLKSVFIAKRMIPVIFICIALSYLHDPISRQLFDDKDEQRTWCIVDYSSNLKTYDTFINLFHFLSPFVINILSALAIILRMYSSHRKVQKKSSR